MITFTDREALDTYARRVVAAFSAQLLESLDDAMVRAKTEPRVALDMRAIVFNLTRLPIPKVDP